MMHYGRVGAVWLANDRTGLIPHTARRTYNQAMRIQVLMFLAIINLVACATARTPVTAVAPQPTAAVTAMRAELAPKVSRFLMEIAALEPALFNAGLPEVPATERGLLPGWNDSVCPQVTGLPQPEGVFILGRITQVARAADVTMGGAQCSPNLFIFVTTQPKELLQGMQEQQFAEMYGRSALPTVLDQFIATPRTVRVWYNIGVGGAPTPFKYAFTRVLVVVDQTRLTGVSRGQLAAYIAVVGLAEIRADAQVGDAPTILKLFDGAPQAAPPGLSDWDRAFLKSLYSTATWPERWRLRSDDLVSSMVSEIVP
jgi:hypothetical protein